MIGQITHSSSDTLQENLSSYQIATVLDGLLMEALKPLAEHTNVIQHWLVEMLPLAVSDGRRKISKLPIDQVISLIFTAVLTTDPVKLLDIVKQLKLERNQIFHLIHAVEDIGKDYHRDIVKVLKSKGSRRARYLRKITAVEDRLGSSRTYCLPTLNTCSYWNTQALNFKRRVAEKYYKLAMKKAVEAEYSTGLSISLEDLYNNYVLAIYRAIDKFDSNHGMLASYIQFWFKNASSNPEFDHETNVAFSIPASKRRQLQKSGWINRKGSALMNLSYPIDEQVIEKQIVFQDSDDLMNILVDCGKTLPLDLFMLLSNIPYKLSPIECKKVKVSMMPTPKITLPMGA